MNWWWVPVVFVWVPLWDSCWRSLGLQDERTQHERNSYVLWPDSIARGSFDKMLSPGRFPSKITPIAHSVFIREGLTALMTDSVTRVQPAAVQLDAGSSCKCVGCKCQSLSWKRVHCLPQGPWNLLQCHLWTFSLIMKPLCIVIVNRCFTSVNLLKMRPLNMSKLLIARWKGPQLWTFLYLKPFLKLWLGLCTPDSTNLWTVFFYNPDHFHELIFAGSFCTRNKNLWDDFINCINHFYEPIQQTVCPSCVVHVPARTGRPCIGVLDLKCLPLEGLVSCAVNQRIKGTFWDALQEAWFAVTRPSWVQHNWTLWTTNVKHAKNWVCPLRTPSWEFIIILGIGPVQTHSSDILLSVVVGMTRNSVWTSNATKSSCSWCPCSSVNCFNGNWRNAATTTSSQKLGSIDLDIDKWPTESNVVVDQSLIWRWQWEEPQGRQCWINWSFWFEQNFMSTLVWHVALMQWHWWLFLQARFWHFFCTMFWRNSGQMSTAKSLTLLFKVEQLEWQNKKGERFMHLFFSQNCEKRDWLPLHVEKIRSHVCWKMQNIIGKMNFSNIFTFDSENTKMVFILKVQQPKTLLPDPAPASLLLVGSDFNNLNHPSETNVKESHAASFGKFWSECCLGLGQRKNHNSEKM